MSDNLKVWMADVELSQLLAAIEAVRPRRFLEWGSGGSTRRFLLECPFIEQYVSIEHDGDWYRRVAASVQDPRLTLLHLPPDTPMPASRARKAREQWDQAAEFDPGRLATYAAYPRRLAGGFDFVLVDGRARRYCLPVGFEVLRPGGVLAIHDAQRPEYHEVIGSLGQARFLKPWKQGQVCLVRKG